MQHVEVVKYEKPIGPVHPLLGRIKRTDSRSLHWVHDIFDGKRKVPTFVPKMWIPNVDILDQSNLKAQGIHTSELVEGVDDLDSLGSCTANATMYAASVIVGTEAITKAGFDVSSAVEAEKTAIKWYSRFTFEDEFLTDNWPQEDCGSSGLGAARTLNKDYKLIKKYTHGTNATQIASMLQKGPVIAGIQWMNAFFEPGDDGFIDANKNWTSSGVAGGHEIAWCSLGKVVQDHHGDVDPNKSYIEFPNSWGTTWGDNGWGRMYLSTYQRLRSSVDVIQFVI